VLVQITTLTPSLMAPSCSCLVESLVICIEFFYLVALVVDSSRGILVNFDGCPYLNVLDTTKDR
jgi:hypothetical protein